MSNDTTTKNSSSSSNLTIVVPEVGNIADELDRVAAPDDTSFGPTASELEFLSELENRLRAIYEITNPAKLKAGIVQQAVQRYKGYEDVLARRLKKKYEDVAGKECDRLIDFVNEAHKKKIVSRRTSQVWALKARKWFEEHGDKDDFEIQLLKPIDTTHRGSVVIGGPSVAATKMKKVKSEKNDLVSSPSEPTNISNAESPIVPISIRKDSDDAQVHTIPGQASKLVQKVFKPMTPMEALPKISIEKKDNVGPPIPPADLPHLDKLRNLLHDIYSVVNPDKLDQGVVAYAMDRYAGYEDVLAQRLLAKYEKQAPKEIHALKEWIDCAHHEGNMERRTTQQWANQARLVFTKDEENELGLLSPLKSEHRGSLLGKSSSSLKLESSGSLVSPTTPSVPTNLDDDDDDDDDTRPKPKEDDMKQKENDDDDDDCTKPKPKEDDTKQKENDNDDTKQPDENIPTAPPSKDEEESNTKIKERYAELLRATYVIFFFLYIYRHAISSDQHQQHQPTNTNT